MSDNIKHLDLDSEDFEDAPKALRDYARNLKKQFEQAVAERDGVRKQLASKAVSEVLGDKGFKNPKRVERDLLADGIDPLDNSAVEAWLADNSDDYARETGSTAPPTPVETPPTESPEQATVRSAYEQMSAATSGLRAPADLSKFDAASLEISDDMTPEQVREVYVKHGI
jgi:hypothetical protein